MFGKIFFFCNNRVASTKFTGTFFYPSPTPPISTSLQYFMRPGYLIMDGKHVYKVRFHTGYNRAPPRTCSSLLLTHPHWSSAYQTIYLGHLWQLWETVQYAKNKGWWRTILEMGDNGTHLSETKSPSSEVSACYKLSTSSKFCLEEKTAWYDAWPIHSKRHRTVEAPTWCLSSASWYVLDVKLSRQL